MDTPTLTIAAINGDRGAIEVLIRSHYQQLYKTAYIYVKNEADALDIVQETMVKIIKQVHTLNEPSYFTTWAVRITMFTALDFLKKKRPDELDEQLAAPEEVLSAEAKLDIYEALARLPEHLREVTVLYYFHGQKIREIAEVFNEPVGTVKYQLHEARNILKNYLKAGDQNEF